MISSAGNAFTSTAFAPATSDDGANPLADLLDQCRWVAPRLPPMDPKSAPSFASISGVISSISSKSGFMSNPRFYLPPINPTTTGA
jgi:hypothetical protein